jgi:predicted transcriptional regulator
MNFNIYVNKKTGESINKIAKNLHRSRNSIISEALDKE